MTKDPPPSGYALVTYVLAQAIVELDDQIPENRTRASLVRRFDALLDTCLEGYERAFPSEDLETVKREAESYREIFHGAIQIAESDDPSPVGPFLM